MELTDENINDWYMAAKENVTKNYLRDVEVKGLGGESEKRFMKDMQKLHEKYRKYNNQMKIRAERKQKFKEILLTVSYPIRMPIKFLIIFIINSFKKIINFSKNSKNSVKESYSDTKLKMDLVLSICLFIIYRM